LDSSTRDCWGLKEERKNDALQGRGANAGEEKL